MSLQVLTTLNFLSLHYCKGEEQEQKEFGNCDLKVADCVSFLNEVMKSLQLLQAN